MIGHSIYIKRSVYDDSCNQSTTFGHYLGVSRPYLYISTQWGPTKFVYVQILKYTVKILHNSLEMFISFIVICLCSYACCLCLHAQIYNNYKKTKKKKQKKTKQQQLKNKQKQTKTSTITS